MSTKSMKREKSERGEGGGSLKKSKASAGEAAGDFLFFLSNHKKFLSATKPIRDATPAKPGFGK